MVKVIDIKVLRLTRFLNIYLVYKKKDKLNLKKHTMTIEQQNNIIRTLKEVDGETVQYILEKIGMDSQMLRQLIMTMPLESVHAEIAERFELEKSLSVRMAK